MNYLKEKITEAVKPENLLKRQNELNRKIREQGAAAFSFENVCRLAYGDEAVDLWKHKEAARAKEEDRGEQRFEEERGN